MVKTEKKSKNLETMAQESDAKKAFETESGTDYDVEQERLSDIPDLDVNANELSENYARSAAIKLDLMDLREEYGEKKSLFQRLVSGKGVYTIGDKVGMKWHKLPVVGNKKKFRAIQINAAQRKGVKVSATLDDVEVILDKKYQVSVDNVDLVNEIRIDQVQATKDMDKLLIERAKQGNFNHADYTKQVNILGERETALSEINETFKGLKYNLEQAQEAKDAIKVKEISREVDKVLNQKHTLMDRVLDQDKKVSDIRRNILDAAKGVESAEGTLAAYRVNYKVIGGLVDAANEQEIMFKYTRSDTMKNLKIQARIADAGESMLDQQKLLDDLSNVSNELNDHIVDLTDYFTRATFEQFQKKTYDPKRLAVKEKEIDGKLRELNQLKMEYAKNRQKMTDVMDAPSYGTHE